MKSQEPFSNEDKMNTKEKSFGKSVSEGLSNMIRIMFREFQLIFGDAGIIIVVLAAPLLYPVIYSLIYKPEVVREMPVAVVDLSQTSQSRDFLRKVDATPDLSITASCISMDEAIQLFKNREVRGIVEIPKDFSTDLATGRQTTVSAYADMEFFLYYKALMTGVSFATLDFGNQIQIQKLQEAGKSEAEISSAVQPIDIVDHSIGNRVGGFASYSIPVALILIIQQTIVLAIGIMAGTARERHQYHTLISTDRRRLGTFRLVFGKALAYFILYALLSVYLLGIIPKWFGYAQTGSFVELAALIVPYLLASIFMGIALSVVYRDRESPMMLYIFITIPLLFLSGVTWPLSNFSHVWLLFRELFPSSNAIFGFIKLNTLGATIYETRHEIASLWIQSGVYFVLACIVYALQVRRSERIADQAEQSRLQRLSQRLRGIKAV